MIKDPKPYDLCTVVWEDAYTESSAQYDSPQAAVQAHHAMIRRSVGLFLGRTEEVVVIATDDDRSALNPTAVGGISYIPAGMVKGIETQAPAPKGPKRVRKRA